MITLEEEEGTLLMSREERKDSSGSGSGSGTGSGPGVEMEMGQEQGQGRCTDPQSERDPTGDILDFVVVPVVVVVEGVEIQVLIQRTEEGIGHGDMSEGDRSVGTVLVGTASVGNTMVLSVGTTVVERTVGDTAGVQTTVGSAGEMIVALMMTMMKKKKKEEEEQCTLSTQVGECILLGSDPVLVPGRSGDLGLPGGGMTKRLVVVVVVVVIVIVVVMLQ
jgi:hypothetical protein